MLPKNAGLRHVALAVRKLDECEQFYNLLGMKTELKSDEYVYLTHYGDNLSLHRVEQEFSEHQRLEHIGFSLESVAAVNNLYEEVCHHQLNIVHQPQTFGIGTHGFSIIDPDGIEVEFTYHPPMWAIE
jgi:catechol 2,3-dioxygenase-like lactoylglutathione lyase family enzyme